MRPFIESWILGKFIFHALKRINNKIVEIKGFYGRTSAPHRLFVPDSIPKNIEKL